MHLRKFTQRQFRRYEEIISHLEKVANENKDLVSLTYPGLSHEGRYLPLLQIGANCKGERTRAVWIDAGIHARYIIH